MKKKLLIALGLSGIIAASVAVGAYAASDIKLFVNGKKTTASIEIIDGSSYVPLRVVAEALGQEVKWDENKREIHIGKEVDPSSETALPASSTVKGITVSLNKVVQDSDSLKLYVTYSNKSNDKVMTGDSLVKVISNGKQYEYDSNFNFERFYKKPVDKSPDFIEPTVSANSVIFLKPIDGADKINIVLKANFEEFKFNNVKVN